MAYKHVILVGDGMADYPISSLGQKTPLEVANTPFMDLIASGEIGLVKTIPEGMEPGSDVANLSILGYDPKRYHTGRAPLEAASKGIRLSPNQTAFRMNLVSLSFGKDNTITMLSHSGGDIGQREALELLHTLQERLSRDGIQIHPGVAYRHLLLWENAPPDLPNIPPHDHLGEDIRKFLEDPAGDPLWELVRSSWEILPDHPVNKRRKESNLLPANSIWLWGQGKAPLLSPFEELFGVKGAVISAVDLVKGLGFSLGLEVIEVPGATGYLDSNFKGKADKAIEALEELDFVFLHVEAPDEASHGGDLEKKIRAIEVFDREVV
ncbi:MAG: 2,3-bisphosphoglycerate-independent phosphoglycerate mutase, partial [Desulfatiglandales bacterium]